MKRLELIHGRANRQRDSRLQEFLSIENDQTAIMMDSDQPKIMAYE